VLSGKLNKYDIEDAKEEQKKIINEIKSIKHNLDDIIKDTNNLSHMLKKNNI
jgi:flagellar biosynthesis chaperone FliJ